MAGARFFVIGDWTGCAGGWLDFGVGAGIGFGFGGATCRGGVADLEEPGLLVLEAFWSFANRFSRIYPSSLNIFHDICCGFVYPVSVVLGGWAQLVRIWIGAHGGRRDYR